MSQHASDTTTDVIERQSPCHACSNAKDTLPECVTAVGTPVLAVTPILTSVGPTRYDFYQCSDCGTLWMESDEQGIGQTGSAPIVKKLTKGYL